MAVEPEKRRRKDTTMAATASTASTSTTTATTTKDHHGYYATRLGLLPQSKALFNNALKNTAAASSHHSHHHSHHHHHNHHNSVDMLITNAPRSIAVTHTDSEETDVTSSLNVEQIVGGSEGDKAVGQVKGEEQEEEQEKEEEEVVPGEKAKLTHEKVDIRPTKNIKMKQHLCVQHALPKTRLTNAILYENVSQGRHLDMKLAVLQHDKHRSSFSMDLNKRAFMAQQDRKRHKWKREDEVRIAAMNLPSFTPEGEKPSSYVPGRKTAAGSSRLGGHRRPSVETIYHLSGTEGRAESATEAGRKPLLPMMKIRRERTEIVSHQDKVFVTKLPSVLEVDQHKLHVHNAYCGKALLDRGVPSRDDRFQRLHTTLSPAILTGEDEYPLENQLSKSRLSKYVTTSPAVSEPLPHRPEARVMVASRGKANAQGLDVSVSSAPGCQRSHAIDFITERKKGGKDIIDMFRSKDIKSLARSLTTDASGMRVGAGVGAGGGGGKGNETDRSMTSKPGRHNVFVPVVDVFYKVKTGS